MIKRFEQVLSGLYTAYETFDNEVDRDKRTMELMQYNDKEIVCTNIDDDNDYILQYTVKNVNKSLHLPETVI